VKAFAAVALTGLALTLSAQAAPNVVLIVTDDQRVGSLGPLRTPAIWNLIRRPGVAYTNAHVPTSLCCPSRASILTGLFAHSTGMYGNRPPYGGWPTFYGRGLEERTLAVALSEAGYRTGLVGKYLNGGRPFPGHTPAGWDVFAELPGGYYNYTFEGVTYGGAPADYATDVLRDRAVRFIKETPSEQPLFLHFAPFAPHLGAIPAPRHQGSWRGRLTDRDRVWQEQNLSDKPPWLRHQPRLPQARITSTLERTQESLLAVDEAVASIHAELVAAGRAENTLFVYISDNGVLYGEHRVFYHKNLPYRAATRVPLLLRWDGHAPAGATAERLALNVDLAATISRAAGVRMRTEGLDLLRPNVRRGFPLEGKSWFVRSMGARIPSFCGYRTRRYGFVRYRTGFEELYDYRHDPQELSNRAKRKSYDALRKRLRKLARLSCRPTPPGFAWR
jgi:N-acetylglucosamine-6-sulfatase